MIIDKGSQRHTFTGLETLMGSKFRGWLHQLYVASGAINVCSGLVEKCPPDMITDYVTYEAIFDSSYWTGRATA